MLQRLLAAGCWLLGAKQARQRRNYVQLITLVLNRIVSSNVGVPSQSSILGTLTHTGTGLYVLSWPEVYTPCKAFRKQTSQPLLASSELCSTSGARGFVTQPFASRGL